MNRLLCFLAILWLPLGTAVAAPLPHVPPATPGVESLESAETLIYAERGSDDRIRRLLDEADSAFADERDAALRSYWQARTALLRATYFNQRGDTRAAEASIDDGFARIERALADGRFSDGLRVVADLHSQRMFARGLFYMIRNGDDARDAALAARELAPANIDALITVAGFLLNAPPIAGGDPAEARAVLTEALELDPESENDRYLILGWLARAADELGDDRAAQDYLRRAASIHGETEWLRSIESQFG